jgi:hypothetical protein
MKPLITLHWVIEMQAFFVLLTKAEFTNPRGASVFVSLFLGQSSAGKRWSDELKFIQLF